MTAWYQYPITHGYYSDYDPRIADTPHQAVDIGTPFHTPITAFKSGKVVQADYAPWGGEVFIQPDDGSTEYYFYHFDENDVVQGQHVIAGQTLGLSGGQNSGGKHPISTQWSTGPHTHVGFFTGWEATPIGTRSVGPDITATIKNLAIGGIPPDNGTTETQNIAGFTIPSMHTIGLNVGVFFVAIILIIAGSLFLFRKELKHVI